MQNFAKVQNMTNAVQRILGPKPSQPRIAFILGTGLGAVTDSIKNSFSIPFADLPGFPLSGVASHAGRFIAGTLADVPVIVQQGRCHLYEGYSAADVCMGARVMARLGARILVVTNAAGALNPSFSAGSVMAISDHINGTGASPLTGPNDDAAGPRFPDMSAAYDKDLLALAEKTALRYGIRLEKGVYMGLAGPQLETPAETRACRILGADAVGMSTVLEVIAARHMGLRVLGLSCLSNKNLPDCMMETSLEEIIHTAGLAGQDLSRIIEGLVPQLV